MVQVWVSPQQELHTFPRGHCHHRAQMGSDVEDVIRGRDLAASCFTMKQGEVNVQLMKFEDVQLKLGLSAQMLS